MPNSYSDATFDASCCRRVCAWCIAYGANTYTSHRDPPVAPLALGARGRAERGPSHARERWVRVSASRAFARRRFVLHGSAGKCARTHGIYGKEYGSTVASHRAMRREAMYVPMSVLRRSRVALTLSAKYHMGARVLSGRNAYRSYEACLCPGWRCPWMARREMLSGHRKCPRMYQELASRKHRRRTTGEPAVLLWEKLLRKMHLQVACNCIARHVSLGGCCLWRVGPPR